MASRITTGKFNNTISVSFWSWFSGYLKSNKLLFLLMKLWIIFDKTIVELL